MIACTVTPPEGHTMAPSGHSLRLQRSSRVLASARAAPGASIDSNGRARVTLTLVPTADTVVPLRLEYVLLDAAGAPQTVAIDLTYPLRGAGEWPPLPVLAVGDSLHLDTLEWSTGPEPVAGEPVLLVSSTDPASRPYLFRRAEAFPGLAVVALDREAAGAPVRSAWSQSVAAELARISESSAVVLLDGERRIVFVGNNPYGLAPAETIASLLPPPEMPSLTGKTLDCRYPGTPFGPLAARFDDSGCFEDGRSCAYRVDGSTLHVEMRDRLPGSGGVYTLVVAPTAPTLFAGTVQMGSKAPSKVECTLEAR